jgi:WD40 repeat protein
LQAGAGGAKLPGMAREQDGAKDFHLRVVSAHLGDSFNAVAWSPDGRLFASGSSDNTVRIWDPASGKLLRTLEGHAYSVLSVSFSPDGKALASGSDEPARDLRRLGYVSPATATGCS